MGSCLRYLQCPALFSPRPLCDSRGFYQRSANQNHRRRYAESRANRSRMDNETLKIQHETHRPRKMNEISGTLFNCAYGWPISVCGQEYVNRTRTRMTRINAELLGFYSRWSALFVSSAFY